MSESIAFVVHLPGKPEHRAELESRLHAVLEAMSAEPDFVNTFLHRAQDDPDTLVLYETWSCSREYFLQHHLARPYRQAYEAALPALLKAERQITFLDPVRALLPAAA